MSKGSNRRPTDAEAFNNNFDAIFGRKSCCEHASDCAVHNEPAYPAGPCDCKLITGEIGTVDCGITFKKGEQDGDVKHRPGG